jgi:hypothetical protein
MHTLSTYLVYGKKKFYLAKSIPFYFVDYDLASESKQNKIVAKMMKGIGDICFPFVRIGRVVVIGCKVSCII